MIRKFDDTDLDQSWNRNTLSALFLFFGGKALMLPKCTALAVIAAAAFITLNLIGLRMGGVPNTSRCFPDRHLPERSVSWFRPNPLSCLIIITGKGGRGNDEFHIKSPRKRGNTLFNLWQAISFCKQKHLHSNNIFH